MDSSELSAISPLDGRYHKITSPLCEYFSESALILHRLIIEITYLQHLSSHKIIRSLSIPETQLLDSLKSPTTHQLKQIKRVESKTHHDVKAVEYYLQTKLTPTTLKDLIPFIHFGLTSEDVNNLSYRLMIQSAHHHILVPHLKTILNSLAEFSSLYASLPMLARTHGQPAIPTTLGKEMSVFATRLLHQLQKLDSTTLTGKLNGAVGSFQALQFAEPRINWVKFSNNFVKHLGLTPHLNTTQSNPADDIINLLHSYHLTNTILLDLCQDIWRYISDNWLIQKGKTKYVGSSTMPQKVNPIEFENSEGNLVLANGLIDTLSRKLPVSRLQRDLSDSTVFRNIGSVFGYSFIAYHNLLKGLPSITPNHTQINYDLNSNWNILGEPLQTFLRKSGNLKAYESIAAKMKGRLITQNDWLRLTRDMPLKVQHLTPQTYIGLAPKLTQQAVKQITKYIHLQKGKP